MYINFKYLENIGLDPCFIMTLIMIGQNKFEDLQEYIIEWWGHPELGAFIEQQKNGKYVLSKAGRELIETIQIPDVTDNDIELYNWLISEAKDRTWDIGSKKKVLGLIVWWRTNAGVTEEELYEILTKYLLTEDSKYNKKLEYLFFKPENMYSKRKLEESRLYNWYENNMKSE